MSIIKNLHKVLFLLAMLIPINGIAQTLEITKAFKMNEFSTVLTTYKNEFGHRVKQGVKDNAFPYVVIEVELEGDEHAVTAAKEKLSLDMGALYMVEGITKQYNNKIVFLVPSSVRTIYMECGDGCKEQVIIEGMQLKPDRIYYGTVRYTPAIAPVVSTTQAPKRQFFKLYVSPADALVEVNENGTKNFWRVTNGIATKALNYGDYSYTVSANRYHMEEGVFTVSDSQNSKTITLRPKFGWLSVSGGSETNDASVYAIHKQTGARVSLGEIPLSEKELDAGEYQVLIQQDKYKDYTTSVIIEEGKTSSLKVSLIPNFVQVTLTTQQGADILIDGTKLGTSRYSGTLELGDFSIETRQTSHKSAYTQVSLSAASAGKSIALNNPVPIYGSMIIEGLPMDAIAYVDGKNVGATPLIINELLIGSHKVRIEKDGYDKYEKTIQVTEGQEEVLKYELVKEVSKSLQPATNSSVAGSGMVNGHKYVDLGLSVLWATCNVGASKPEEYGDYFSWGETRSKTNYDWRSYKWCKGDERSATKYCKNSSYGKVDNKTTLDLSDDAAYANWGGSWCMPTEKEFLELLDNCTWTWSTQSGVKGYKVTSKINGNSIFLPAAGCHWNSSFLYAGKEGQYWSKTLAGSAIGGAALKFNSAEVSKSSFHAKDGLSVRPVCPKPSRQNGNIQTNVSSNSSTASSGMVNGHAYVDLGLSVKWATCNVGASKPEEYGDYFSWGETRSKTNYDWRSYKWCKGDERSATKYCKNSSYGKVDNKTTLDLSDDAAYANWGGSWCMPTEKEFLELLDNCTWTWSTQSGVKGYKVTSKINGNSIFLPAAGYHFNSSFLHAGEEGRYWSKTLSAYAISGALQEFNSAKVHRYSCSYAFYGLSVRPVCR